MDKAFKKIMEGVNPPSGTEGIVCVQITTATGSRDLKCCMIKNNGQCKLLLPQVEHLEKENINVLSACFYDYRKKASYQLEIALEDLQIEEDCRHQFLPFDSEVTGIGTRRFSLRKTKSEKVQSYFETFSKGIKDVERCDLCSNGEKLFGVKNTGGSDRRAEFVELELSAHRKVTCRDMSSLYPNGPLFHGKVVKPFQDSNFQKYEVQVVGSYSVVNGEISTHLFVEEQLVLAIDLPDGPSSSSSAIEKSNHISKLRTLVLSVGTKVFRDVFDSIHPPSSLHGVLNSRPVQDQLAKLLSRKILRTKQWEVLYSGSQQGVVESKNFDITLLFVLLRNICGLNPPVSTGSWDKEPLPGDESTEADLVRIQQNRNDLVHSGETAITDDTFESTWQDIEAALNRLGQSRYEEEIANIKCLESADYDRNSMPPLEALMRENTMEIKKIGERLNVISENMTKEVKQNEQENKGTQDVESYVEKLKAVIIKQTEMMPKGIIGSEQVQIDAIFTNLIVRHGKQSNMRTGNEEEKHACEALPEIEEYSEIFIDKDGRNSKRILVSGEPGIGKTMFSQKLIRDLAANNIVIPGVRYTYLIPLRKLTELDDDCQRISLIELLNMCPLLDDTVMIEEQDKAVINDICENSAQLFIILDGWEEFKGRSKIAKNLASKDQFANNAKSKMSVTALVGRLINGKILRNCVIMITSRPGEANDLNFDKFVQIAGFSESQVFGYVVNYFSSRPEEVKNEALNRVRGSPHYKSFGSVPFRCYLMCIDIEDKIATHRRDSDTFNTLTEFYSRIVHFIERNYNREMLNLDDPDSGSAVDETIVSLAKVAHTLLKQHRFSFSTKDFKKLNLSPNQSLRITSSNLITYNAVSGDSRLEAPTHLYSFTHPNIQEFFAAWYFVKIEDAIPMQETTEMVKMFSSGLMGLQGKEDDKMLELLKRVQEGVFNKQSMALRCLYEYGKDRDVTSQELTKNPDYLYWNCDGAIMLSDMTDSDCSAIAMLVDKSSAASSPPNKLHIYSSPLNCGGLEILLSSLVNQTCKITELLLWDCQLDNECAKCLSKYLSKTKIAELKLVKNNINKYGMQCIVDSSNCKVTSLENPASDRRGKAKKWPSLSNLTQHKSLSDG